MKQSMSQLIANRFTRFVLAGLCSLAVEYILFFWMVSAAHIDVMVATTVSFALSVVVSYFLSMRFVFDRRDDLSRRREFTIFAVLSGVGLCLNDLYMYVGVAMLNVGYQGMKIVATFLVTWFNYFSRRYFLDASRI